MAGEGQILRDARVQKGWNITQAEDITKIRVRYLEALEEENYRVLPGSTYVKGFLRTYAKHLGLDSEEIISLYKSSEVVEDQPKINSVINTPKKRPQWLRPALFALTGLLTLALVIGIASMSKPGGKDIGTEFTPTPLPSAPSEDTQPAESDPAAEPSQSQPSVQDPSTITAEEIEGLKVQLVFTQKVWLVVHVDGKPALEGTYDQGMTEEVNAKEQIELVNVGNAGGVSITLNGKTLPSLGSQGQVVRNVVLKKETVNQISFQP
jgi:cytoskeletal protein RodZ